jgi:hypothetical protein
MTDFLAGYVVPPGAGLADDPGLKASQHSSGGVELHRIGELYGIRVVPD